MPPKKKPTFTAGNVLNQVQQTKRVSRLDELKSLSVEQLTETLIRATPQITVLKKWGAKLSIPGLLEFKAADASRLQELLVFYLRKFRSRDVERPENLMGEVAPIQEDEVKGEPSQVDQLSIIVKFIQTYSRNPKKVAALYGEAGKEFERMWNTLTRQQKVLFVSDYLAELENRTAKEDKFVGKPTKDGTEKPTEILLNPIVSLKSFLENTVKEQKETVDGPATRYLRAFIENYAELPSKWETQVATEAPKFLEKFVLLSDEQKAQFAGEYIQHGQNRDVLGELEKFLVKKPSEEHLKLAIEKTLKDQKEFGAPVVKYLQAFVHVDSPSKWKQQMTAEAPRLEEFLARFGNLDLKHQVWFAGEYVRYGANREVVGELEKFLIKNPVAVPQRHPIGRLQAPGYNLTTGVNATEQTKNRYKKCSDYLNQKKWVLFNDGIIPSEWLGDLVVERRGWAYPTPQFYQALCFHQSRFRLEDGRLLIYLPNRVEIVQVGRESSGKIVDDVIVLLRDLEMAQRDNLFSKLSPEWVLNVPLYQVESIYIDQIKVFFQGEYEDIFSNQFSDLVKKCREKTLLNFYHTFLATFYPCFAENNFPIASQVKKGYITAEYYYQLSDTQKVNSIKVPELRDYLRKWLSGSVQQVAGRTVEEPGVARWLISTAGKNFRQVKIPKLKLAPSLFFYPETELCATVRAEWNTEDIVIYQGDCFVAAELLERFLDNDLTNPLHPETQFDDQFYEVVTKTFFPRFRGARVESKRFPVQYRFVNKPEYEMKNQPGEKKRERPKDVSGEFDTYFGVKRIILEPVALIENLLHFDIPPMCAECKDPVEAKTITSLVNRSDGSVIKVDFCTYKCMLKHEFTPVHTVEEEADAETDFFEAV